MHVNENQNKKKSGIIYYFLCAALHGLIQYNMSYFKILEIRTLLYIVYVFLEVATDYNDI